jgi:hypothetical protein
MLIGAAAAELRVSPSLLRKLEAEGAIPPVTRDRAGWRRYTPEDIAAIRRALYPQLPRPEPPRRRPVPPSELVWATLRLDHGINGERYGPGRCQVPRALLRELLATEQRAAETGIA